MQGAAIPPLEPGLIALEQPDVGALHRLVLAGEWRRACDGELDHTGANECLWVDAGGAASTYGLTAREPMECALRGIRVARAFTAHQHHQLVRDAVAVAGERTGLVVAPNVAALYEAADAPVAEVDRLFEASVALLSALGESLGVPVLVSAPRASDDRRTVVYEHAGETIECRRTDLGYAFATDDFETTVYWQQGWWQTTVPYWVDRLGAVAAWSVPEPTGSDAVELDVSGSTLAELGYDAPQPEVALQ